MTWLRVDGMQRMAERKNFAEITEAMRLEISGALETRGHAIVGYYISDPDAALVEIENASMGSCRVVAEAAGLDLERYFCGAGETLAPPDAVGSRVFHAVDQDFGADEGRAQAA